MSRKKTDEQEQILSLERELKEAEATIKALERHLRKHNISHDPEETKTETVKQKLKDNTELCKECNRGSLEKVEVAGRSFKICSHCRHRTKTTIEKKPNK
jgi:chromosome segregation ATPase